MVLLLALFPASILQSSETKHMQMPITLALPFFCVINILFSLPQCHSLFLSLADSYSLLKAQSRWLHFWKTFIVSPLHLLQQAGLVPSLCSCSFLAQLHPRTHSTCFWHFKSLLFVIRPGLQRAIWFITEVSVANIIYNKYLQNKQMN